METALKRPKTEISTFYGKCRCCLDFGYMKNMWTKHEWENANEVYGDMLKETYSITLQKLDEIKAYICESCVIRLRDAYNFKQQILASDEATGNVMSEEIEAESENLQLEKMEEFEDYEELNEDLLEEDGYGQSTELIEDQQYEVEFLKEEYEDEDTFEDKDYEIEIDDSESEETCSSDYEAGKARKGNRHRLKKIRTYTDKSMRQCVEAVLSGELEIQDACKKYKVPNKIVNTKIRQLRKAGNNVLDITYTDETVPRERLPKRRRQAYSEETLKECMKMVLSGQMNERQASQRYGVPQKTLNNNIRRSGMTKIKIVKLNEHKSTLYTELKNMFTFTNVAPFKSKTGKFYCAYCFDRENYFEDSQDLRDHMKNHDLVKDLEKFLLREKVVDQIFRVDIDNFCCTQCIVPLRTWNDMFIHLKEEHDIDFDAVYTKVIPYRLKDDKKKCVLCNQSFPTFSFLDGHMNSHYCNYVCSECGDTFLTNGRLKNHILMHNTKEFPCPECGKVFSLNKYMKKHYLLVHNKMKTYKCMYCSEHYKSELDRHAHVTEKHKEKVTMYTCDHCGKTFDWKPYYLKHIRKTHYTKKKNKCRYCDRRFKEKNEVVLHEQRHTGTGKRICAVCGNNYVTLMELRSHMKRHEKEKLKQLH